MFTNIKNAFKDTDLRKKMFLTLILIFLFRVGSWLPIPGINVEAFSEEIAGQDFLGIISGLTGGALSNGAFLALGVAPYISASIIMQLLTIAIPYLEKLKKMGEEGRKKITKYTKYTALFLATAQAIGIIFTFGAQNFNPDLFGSIAPLWATQLFVVLALVSGAMFTYWLGEKITEVGIGNGVSLLIFVGIISSAAVALQATLVSAVTENIEAIWELIGFAGILVLIFGLIVFISFSERKVPVQYAKQIKGRKMYGGQSTYIPMKVNGSGVLPIIFAMSLLSFPQLLMSIFWPTSDFFAWYSRNLGMGSWMFTVLSGILILFFAYFYSQMVFNPSDVSKRLQQNGGFIPGIRPGRPTTGYLSKINKRITLFGALFLAFIAIVPTLIFQAAGVDTGLINAFSATGMLIVVSVAIEFNRQLESQMLMKAQNNKGFLK